jgi:hypothetical protein
VDSEDITHSGTGRFTWLMMRPMSLYESGESSGEVSLKDLFNKPDKITGISEHNIDDLTFLICRGGWQFIFRRLCKYFFGVSVIYFSASWRYSNRTIVGFHPPSYKLLYVMPFLLFLAFFFTSIPHIQYIWQRKSKLYLRGS